MDDKRINGYKRMRIMLNLFILKCYVSIISLTKAIKNISCEVRKCDFIAL